MTEKPEADGVVTVAELLARHGKVSGAGSRAHRRRAREGGISVAELTGEIPIVRDPAAEDPAAEDPAVEDPAAEAPDEASADAADAPDEAGAPEESDAEKTGLLEPAEVPSAPAAPAAQAVPAEPRAYSNLDAVADAGPQSPREFASTASFPAMTPLASSILSAEKEPEPEFPAPDAAVGHAPAAAEGKGALRQWAALTAQAVVGVAVGAALFVGFERLWDSLPYVALVLAILAILAMVAVVRILRKTDDIVSMLMAVVVGVIVTIGPLAFVLSTR